MHVDFYAYALNPSLVSWRLGKPRKVHCCFLRGFLFLSLVLMLENECDEFGK